MNAKPYLREVSLKDGMQSPEGYPFSIPAIAKMSQVEFHEDVTFIIGENGSGKSTFLEAVAQYLGLSQEGGSRHNSQIQAINESSLHECFRGSKSFRKPKQSFFLRAESFYNIATHLDEVYKDDPGLFEELYGVESLHKCSHGESFLAILAKRLVGDGLYLFDEPEAALSPNRQLTALSLINKLVKKRSQFIIATHSPILLAYPNASIYQFDEEGIRPVSYEECEPYRVTKSFLNNHQYMTDLLTGPDFNHLNEKPREM